MPLVYAQNTLNIIPQPVSIQQYSTHFVIGNQVSCSWDNTALATQAELLQEAFLTLTGKKLITQNTQQHIKLIVAPQTVEQTEGYQLEIQPHQIQIVGHDEAGVFYGVQTLIQLLYQHKTQLPSCKIIDYPRFGYRGLHLDVGRNMFSLGFLKKYIDLLAFYKLNTFHWHLTEDQGWRIEIKKYPRLQSVSAYRNETIIGHKKDSPHRFDGKRYGGYYTQEEVKELVKYAQIRHVTIIPEIEMPGHARAALAAYPQLGCTGGPYQTATFWGVFDDVFCAGNDSTFLFLTNVLDEILPLFPSKYIHIGGDECPKVRWKTCPKCQKVLHDNHLTDEHELQSYFIQKIEKYVNLKGKSIIGWDEILEGGLSPNATVMSWRGEDGGIAAAQQKHDVIMSPESHYYLDYYQSLHLDEPIATAGFTPLQKVYNYEPVPAVLLPSEQKYIKGIQANVWSEYLISEAQAEYMVFPRALALAETAWSPRVAKNYPFFLQRLRKHQAILAAKKVNFFKRFEEIDYSFTTYATGKTSIIMNTTLPNAQIRYSLDGHIPQITDPIVPKELLIEKTNTVKAQIFVGKKPYGKVFEQMVNINKATGKKITLTNAPKGNFNPKNPFTLNNGIIGTHRYNEGQWSGFSGENLEAVVDLEKSQNIKEIGISILKYHWQRMWEPSVLTFAISNDGQNFIEVYQQTAFPSNAINTIKVPITPISARYIKITGINKGIIPAGEYGAGNKAWLIVDEIVVN